MTSQWLPSHVLIHSRLVVGEVLEHGEGSLSRSIGHQLHLDSLDIPPDGVALLTIGLVLLIGDLVLGVVTGSVTLGCAGALLTRHSRTIDMVLTGLDDVWLTSLVAPILSP